MFASDSEPLWLSPKLGAPLAPSARLGFAPWPGHDASVQREWSLRCAPWDHHWNSKQSNDSDMTMMILMIPLEFQITKGWHWHCVKSHQGAFPRDWEAGSWQQRSCKLLPSSFRAEPSARRRQTMHTGDSRQKPGDMEPWRSYGNIPCEILRSQKGLYPFGCTFVEYHSFR